MIFNHIRFLYIFRKVKDKVSPLKTISFMLRNHIYCPAKPYLLPCKTISFATRNHTFRAAKSRFSAFRPLFFGKQSLISCFLSFQNASNARQAFVRFFCCSGITAFVAFFPILTMAASPFAEMRHQQSLACCLLFFRFFTERLREDVKAASLPIAWPMPATWATACL